MMTATAVRPVLIGLCAATLLVTVSLLTLPRAVAAHPFIALYGEDIHFRVLRRQQPVGEYTTRFETTADGWQAHVQMQLSLRLLHLFDYEYQYHSTETWAQNQLQSLQVSINDNGEEQNLNFSRDRDALVAPDQTRIDLPVLTSHHFNPAIVDATRLLNTLTGRENRIKLQLQGEETLQIGARSVVGKRYRYTGELHGTDVWYGPQGQWLKLQFADRSGAPIEFECIRCGLADASSAP